MIDEGHPELVRGYKNSTKAKKKPPPELVRGYKNSTKAKKKPPPPKKPLCAYTVFFSKICPQVMRQNPGMRAVIFLR
jgi:hypothetical protein